MEAWNILVADDDTDVHNITDLVLGDITFLDRPLRITFALNEKETMHHLNSSTEFCVILLDVVMDSAESGFKIIEHIRMHQQNTNIRIILRTGQPGSAPERQVITLYDINDYKEKTELTSTKLYTAVIAAIRSYNDLHIIEQGRRGLETIVQASKNILEHQSIFDLADGILQQIPLLVQHDNSSIIASHIDGAFLASHQQDDIHQFIIHHGSGIYQDTIGQSLPDVLDDTQIQLISQCLFEKTSIYHHNMYIGYLQGAIQDQTIIFYQSQTALTDIDKYILDLFQSNFELAFKNVNLYEEIKSIQSEIIFKLGDVIEQRSGETGNHVRRVSEHTRLLSTLLQLSQDTCELFSLSSIMHDVGKIGIEDAILLKPGKISQEEFEVMKTHTIIGNHVLSGSKKRVFETAAKIALSHHEQWDGQGYPQGLLQTTIPLEARIVSITDVFDALSHDRCYKKAWDRDQIHTFFTEECGKKFDPELCELFLDHLDEFYDINEKFRDI